MWGFQQEYSRNLLKDELVGRYLHKSCLLATEVLKFLDQDELAALYLNRSAWQPYPMVIYHAWIATLSEIRAHWRQNQNFN